MAICTLRSARTDFCGADHMPLDPWTPHPTSFSSAALEAAVDAARAPVGGITVDPFVGTGRSGTFITGRGDPFVGIDAHVLSAATAAAKLSRPGAPDDLRAAADDVGAGALLRRQAVDIDCEDVVVRRFVAPDPLTDLAALRDEIAVRAGRWTEHLRCALLATLRDATGPGWPYPKPARSGTRAGDVAPLDRFTQRARVIADELAAAPRAPCALIIEGDARDDGAWSDIAPGSASACVSSPPYLNQVSYAEASRIELHFLGLISSWSEMNRLVSSRLVASCTQQVTATRASAAHDALASLPATAALTRILCARLERAQGQRARPKRYDVLVPVYFADMALVLKRLLRALAPEAKTAWVVGDSAPYGVHVDTPALLSVLAEEIGFSVLDDVHLRDRGRRWPGVGGRHSRRLTERLIVFVRPGWGEQQRLPGI